MSKKNLKNLKNPEQKIISNKSLQQIDEKEENTHTLLPSGKPKYDNSDSDNNSDLENEEHEEEDNLDNLLSSDEVLIPYKDYYMRMKAKEDSNTNNEEYLNAVQLELNTCLSEIKSKIEEEQIHIKPNINTTEEIMDKINRKLNPIPIELLIKQDELKNCKKNILEIQNKIRKINSELYLFKYQLKNLINPNHNNKNIIEAHTDNNSTNTNKHTIDKIKETNLCNQINELTTHKNSLQDKITTNNLIRKSLDKDIKLYNNKTNKLLIQEEYIKNFKEDTAKTNKKIKHHFKTSQEITEHWEDEKNKIEEMVLKKEEIIEEKKDQEKQLKQTMYNDKLEKFKAKNEDYHTEVENIVIPETDKEKKYIYQTLEAVFNKKLRKMKLKEEDILGKSNKERKNKFLPISREEIEEFQEKIEVKRKELLEQLEEKRYKELERLGVPRIKSNTKDAVNEDGENPNPNKNVENNSENSLNMSSLQKSPFKKSMFFMKLKEEEQKLAEIKQQRIEDSLSRSEKLKSFTNKLVLPKIDVNKVKEMLSMKIKKVGMHQNNNHNLKLDHSKDKTVVLKGYGEKVNEMNKTNMNTENKFLSTSNSYIYTSNKGNIGMGMGSIINSNGMMSLGNTVTLNNINMNMSMNLNLNNTNNKRNTINTNNNMNSTNGNTATTTATDRQANNSINNKHPINYRKFTNTNMNNGYLNTSMLLESPNRFNKNYFNTESELNIKLQNNPNLLSKDYESLSKFRKRKIKIISPIEIKQPLDKYPDYLQTLRKNRESNINKDNTINNTANTGNHGNKYGQNFNSHNNKQYNNNSKNTNNSNSLIISDTFRMTKSMLCHTQKLNQQENLESIRMALLVKEEETEYKRKLLEASGGAAYNPQAEEELTECILDSVKAKINLINIMKIKKK